LAQVSWFFESSDSYFLSSQVLASKARFFICLQQVSPFHKQGCVTRHLMSPYQAMSLRAFLALTWGLFALALNEHDAREAIGLGVDASQVPEPNTSEAEAALMAKAKTLGDRFQMLLKVKSAAASPSLLESQHWAHVSRAPGLESFGDVGSAAEWLQQSVDGLQQPVDPEDEYLEEKKEIQKLFLGSEKDLQELGQGAAELEKNWHTLILDPSLGNVASTDKQSLQALADKENVELIALLAHGCDGTMWGGRSRKNGQDVVIKFMCAYKECKGGVLDVRSPKSATYLHAECEVSQLAHEKASGMAVGCETLTKEPHCIVYPRSNFTKVESNDDAFFEADAASEHALLGQVLSVMSKFLHAPHGGRILIHGDLTKANILWDKKSGAVQLIDFSQAYTCDTIVLGALGHKQRCGAGLLLMDFYRGFVEYAIRSDLINAEQKLPGIRSQCSEPLNNLNFKKEVMKSETADVFVARIIGTKCTAVLSTWTRSVLKWMAALESELLTVAAQKVSIQPADLVSLNRPMPVPPSLIAMSASDIPFMRRREK